MVLGKFFVAACVQKDARIKVLFELEEIHTGAGEWKKARTVMGALCATLEEVGNNIAEGYRQILFTVCEMA